MDFQRVGNWRIGKRKEAPNILERKEKTRVDRKKKEAPVGPKDEEKIRLLKKALNEKGRGAQLPTPPYRMLQRLRYCTLATWHTPNNRWPTKTHSQFRSF